MTSTLHRTSLSFARADESAERTVFGTLVPFGQTVTVDDGWGEYRERFEFGAFARSIRERGAKVRLFRVHDAARNLPIGRAVSLSEERDGLHGSFLLGDTREADEALSLVRSGIVDAFSISFRPIRHREEAGVTVRTEVALVEVSLVGVPAYSGAEIAGVRSASSVLSVDVARRRLTLALSRWE